MTFYVPLLSYLIPCFYRKCVCSELITECHNIINEAKKSLLYAVLHLNCSLHVFFLSSLTIKLFSSEVPKLTLVYEPQLTPI